LKIRRKHVVFPFCNYYKGFSIIMHVSFHVTGFWWPN
jgi:hypothetical protein